MILEIISLLGISFFTQGCSSNESGAVAEEELLDFSTPSDPASQESKENTRYISECSKSTDFMFINLPKEMNKCIYLMCENYNDNLKKNKDLKNYKVETTKEKGKIKICKHLDPVTD